MHMIANIAHDTSYSADALIDLPAVVVIGGQSGMWPPSLVATSDFNLMFQRERAPLSRLSVGYVGDNCPFVHFFNTNKDQCPKR